MHLKSDLIRGWPLVGRALLERDLIRGWPLVGRALLERDYCNNVFMI